jgi:hypothetical protein
LRAFAKPPEYFAKLHAFSKGGDVARPLIDGLSANVGSVIGSDQRNLSFPLV